MLSHPLAVCSSPRVHKRWRDLPEKKAPPFRSFSPKPLHDSSPCLLGHGNGPTLAHGCFASGFSRTSFGAVSRHCRLPSRAVLLTVLTPDTFSTCSKEQHQQLPFVRCSSAAPSLGVIQQVTRGPPRTTVAREEQATRGWTERRLA